MAKIVLDTCTWIELAKPKYSEVLIELEKQIDEGITIILSCDLIIEEWNRNKDRILKDIQNSIKDYAKNAIQISNYLADGEKTELLQILEKYRNNEDEQLKLAEVHFNRVEDLMRNSIKYSITDPLKVLVTNRAIKKEAPFHNSKNNINDALIYFGAVEEVQGNYVIAKDLIFVTQNINEFSDPINKTQIHPDLKFQDVHYSINLAQALKMRKEIIDEFDEATEYQFEMWVDIQTDIARGK